MEESIDNFESWFIYQLIDAILSFNLRGKLSLEHTYGHLNINSKNEY